MKNNKYLKSFTLIELIVVIAIVGLLASIVLVSTSQAIGKAKIARSLRFSSSVHHALGAYLVGEWKFEETTADTCQNPQNPGFVSACNSTYNDFCDSSGNRNHGCAKGTVSWVDSGVSQLGNAIQTPGGENFVLVSDSPTLDSMNELTIQAWIKPLDDDLDFPIAAAWKWRSYILSLDYTMVGGIKRGRIRFYVETDAGGASDWLVDVDSFKVGQWYHVAATYYGGGSNIFPRMRVFLNGHLIKDTTLTWTSCPCPIKDWTESLRIGGYTFKNNPAVFDEVRIYQGELTSAEIKKLYAEGAIKRGLLVKE